MLLLWDIMNINTQLNEPNNTSLIAQPLFFKSYLFIYFSPHHQLSPLYPPPSPPSFPKLQKGHLNVCIRMCPLECGWKFHVRVLSSSWVQPILGEKQEGMGVTTTFQGEALLCPNTIKDRSFCFLY